MAAWAPVLKRLQMLPVALAAMRVLRVVLVEALAAVLRRLPTQLLEWLMLREVLVWRVLETLWVMLHQLATRLLALPDTRRVGLQPLLALLVTQELVPVLPEGFKLPGVFMEAWPVAWAQVFQEVRPVA